MNSNVNKNQLDISFRLILIAINFKMKVKKTFEFRIDINCVFSPIISKINLSKLAK